MVNINLFFLALDMNIEFDLEFLITGGAAGYKRNNKCPDGDTRAWTVYAPT